MKRFQSQPWPVGPAIARATVGASTLFVVCLIGAAIGGGLPLNRMTFIIVLPICAVAALGQESRLRRRFASDADRRDYFRAVRGWSTETDDQRWIALASSDLRAVYWPLIVVVIGLVVAVLVCSRSSVLIPRWVVAAFILLFAGLVGAVAIRRHRLKSFLRRAAGIQGRPIS